MASKKTFKDDNPALSFMTAQEETLETTVEPVKTVNTAVKPPKGYKYNPEYIETKSKRVQLILQPSVVEKAKELAKKRGLSLNEAFSEAIKEYIEKYQ